MPVWHVCVCIRLDGCVCLCKCVTADCVSVFARLLCSVEWSHKQDCALKCFAALEDILKKMSLHLSPCQHDYSVCKVSWATTASDAYQWGRSMDSSLSVCCEYLCRYVQIWWSQTDANVQTQTFNIQTLALHSFLGLSMVTTYHWYQKEPSKTCHRSPTCEQYKHTHTHSTVQLFLWLKCLPFHLIQLQNKANTLSWQRSHSHCPRGKWTAKHTVAEQQTHFYSHPLSPVLSW